MRRTLVFGITVLLSALGAGADLDLDLIPAAKRSFDSAGHYARPDVFHFEVKR